MLGHILILSLPVKSTPAVPVWEMENKSNIVNTIVKVNQRNELPMKRRKKKRKKKISTGVTPWHGQKKMLSMRVELMTFALLSISDEDDISTTL